MKDVYVEIKDVYREYTYKVLLHTNGYREFLVEIPNESQFNYLRKRSSSAYNHIRSRIPGSDAYEENSVGKYYFELKYTPDLNTLFKHDIKLAKRLFDTMCCLNDRYELDVVTKEQAVSSAKELIDVLCEANFIKEPCKWSHHGVCHQKRMFEVNACDGFNHCTDIEKM